MSRHPVHQIRPVMSIMKHCNGRHHRLWQNPRRHRCFRLSLSWRPSSCLAQLRKLSPITREKGVRSTLTLLHGELHTGQHFAPSWFPPGRHNSLFFLLDLWQFSTLFLLFSYRNLFSAAVRRADRCAVAPHPLRWVRDGQRNWEEKEYLTHFRRLGEKNCRLLP